MVVAGNVMGENIDNSDSSSSDNSSDEEVDEESLLTYYFRQGFKYDKILSSLTKYHNVSMSNSTLLRRFKQLGFSKRGPVGDATIQEAINRIRAITTGPCSAGGYRMVWHTLQMEGFNIPRIFVQEILREIHPVGTQARKAYCLRRRVYKNPGPNFA